MASGEGSRKPRKHNFSASEISILTEKVEENLAILQSKFTNSVTNLKKKQVWSEITAAVNAVGVDKRTETEVREKRKNLHSAAKREFTKFRQESKKTGGGPAPKEISAATSKVIELFQDTPSFVGLAGFETNCSNGKPILLNFHFRINMEHYELNFCFITSHAGLSSIQHHQFQVISHLRKSGQTY